MILDVYDRDGMICPYGGDAIVDAVYVRFGIRASAVIDATEVESEEAEGSQRRDTR